ncbi:MULTISPECIES: RidA family protein [unclassified Sphingobium]|uniref:RidA family protein n=1 Tax=unclassified Sphingobium TaxID=2611147 RepID=UPI00076FF478|nr:MULTISPECIES: RidA family protein [unclassified Sphingobium]AMK22171.1 endoribonuclease L-PSP [Sphingobium sp. TKS]NML88254.1 RidA family protein [Sphingobium sp. TB-6]
MKKWLALFLALGAAPLAAQQPLPFSPAVRAGDTLYLSGQIGQVPTGMDPHKEGFDAAVRNSMDSIGKILKDNGLDFGHVVKCTVMLDDMADWPRFNDVYVSYYQGKRLPARSAFGADGLARGAPLEIECIASFK